MKLFSPSATVMDCLWRGKAKETSGFWVAEHFLCICSPCWTWDTIPKDYPFKWSCPNPYIPKAILTSSRCGTICSTQIPTIPPRTKSLPASSTIFKPEDQMLHWDPTLHCVGRRHALCEVPTAVGHSSTPCNRRAPITRSTTVKFLESPTLASQGPIAPFCAIGVSRLIAPLGGSTSSNITHTYD